MDHARALAQGDDGFRPSLSQPPIGRLRYLELLNAGQVLNDLASVVPRIKAVRELGAGLHASSHIWSKSGQSAVTVWPRCWRAVGLRLGEAVRGKLQWPKS